MRYRELIERLRELGCEELRQGKITAIPDWEKKDLAPGTMRAVIRELGISRQEFGSIR